MRLQAGESRQPELPGKAGARLRLLGSRRCSTKKPNGRDIICCSRSRAWRTASIPTERARWSGSIARSGAAGSAASGARAVDGQQAYFGVSARLPQTPGRHARREYRHRRTRLVNSPPTAKLCGDGRGCNAAPGRRGHRHPGRRLLRVGRRRPARLLDRRRHDHLEFDTNREFQTVNGVKAKRRRDGRSGRRRRRRHALS